VGMRMRRTRRGRGPCGAWVLAFGLLPAGVTAQTAYVPGPHPAWERRDPAALGFRPAALQEAIDFAVASEATSPRDLALNHDRTFGREPRGEAIGPFRDRGPQTGVIVKNGYIVAEWGEPGRVDQT